MTSEATTLDAAVAVPPLPRPLLNIVGLDLSLTATGIASRHRTTTLRPGGQRRGYARLGWLRDAIREHTTGADLIAVEGPSYGSLGPGHHEGAGLWWLITFDLTARNLPVAVISPASRAKYATGRGNAPKDEVLANVVRRFPDYDVRNNNEADSLILAAMAGDHYGQALVVMPGAHRVALNGVEWPAITP